MNEFMSSTSEQLRDIERAVAENDCATIRRRAHAMRTSAATVGAMRLAAMAVDLEALAAVEPCAGMEQICATLMTELARVGRALDHLSPTKTQGA